MGTFGGLYYPGESWDLSIEDSVLKKCLIFFDKIYAIVPEVFSVDYQDVRPLKELDSFLKELGPGKLKNLSSYLRYIKTRGIQNNAGENSASKHEIDRYFRITKFMDKIAMLRKEGIIEVVNPRENLLDPPYWRTHSRLLPLRKRSKPYPWMEISSNYQKGLNKEVKIKELETFKPHILYGSILNDLKDTHFRDIAGELGKERVIVYKGQAEQNWIHQLGNASGFDEDEWQYFPSAVHYYGFPGTVSTVMWAALVVNHTLMTAHRYNLVPITPNIIFNELLQSKIRRLDKVKKAEEEKLKTYIEHPEYRAAFSGFSLAMCSLPNLELLSFEDVLELRVALGDELVAFRDEMFKFAELIKKSPWDTEFQTQVDYIKEHKIDPVVRELRRKLDSIREESTLRNLKMVAAPNVMAVMASVWAGMPPIIVMAVSAGLIGLETALAYYFKRKKVFQSNGLSLLLRFQ